METIKPPMFGKKCEYCPYTVSYISIPDEEAKKLNDKRNPPTHIEIKCPACENVYYYTQNLWDFSFDKKGFWGHIEAERRKTSPGKNIYVPKEDVRVV